MRRIPCRRSLLERDAKGDTSCVGYIILVTSSDYRNDLILFASIFCEGYDFLADGGFTGSSVRLNRVSGFVDDLIADRSAGGCICFQNHLVSVCAGSGDRNGDFLALRQVLTSDAVTFTVVPSLPIETLSGMVMVYSGSAVSVTEMLWLDAVSVPQPWKRAGNARQVRV